MTTLHKVVVGLTALAIVLGVLVLKQPAIERIIEKQVGAVSGPDLYSPYFSVDGVRHEYRSSPIRTATTTPCAFKSPEATSTLLSASLQVNVASSTATVWTVAKATSPFATTTAINSFTLASALRGTFVQLATTSPGAADASVSTIAPNTYIVWGLAGIGTSYDSTKLTGQCVAEFIVHI